MFICVAWFNLFLLLKYSSCWSIISKLVELIQSINYINIWLPFIYSLSCHILANWKINANNYISLQYFQSISLPSYKLFCLLKLMFEKFTNCLLNWVFEFFSQGWVILGFMSQMSL
jgi:hypothetical protein